MDSPPTTEIRHPIHYWWMFILSGTCLIAFSIYVAANPAITYDRLSIFFAATLMVSGIFELAFCIANRRWFNGWGWYMTGAVCDLILVTIFVTNPILSAISLPFLAGFWLLARSLVMVARSLQVKKNRLTEWPWLLLWAVTGLFFSLVNIYNPLFGEGRLVLWTVCSLLTVGIFYVHFGFLVKSSDRWINKHIHT